MSEPLSSGPSPAHTPFPPADPLNPLELKDNQQGLLSCPNCHHLISGADLDIEKTMAVCSQCHHVFGFGHDSSTGHIVFEPLQPEGVEVLKLKSELDIRLSWKKTTSTGGRNFLLLFTTVWNLFLLPFLLMIIVSGNWGILLFMSLHLLVGIGLIWYLAAVFLNRTSLSITPRRIRIHTFPVRHPLYKPREIDTARVRQLYVSKYTQSTTNGVPQFAYALYAVLDDGEKMSLLRGMNRMTQEYLEREIEAFLGIRNVKVEGEDL